MTRQPIGHHAETHDPDTGEDPIRGGRMVRGALFNDASIIEGTGFTASWDNDGGAPASLNYYTITFTTPFTNPPVVLLAGNNNNPAGGLDGEYTVTLKSRYADRIVVITVELDGTPADGGFDFVAIEPAV